MQSVEANVVYNKSDAICFRIHGDDDWRINFLTCQWHSTPTQRQYVCDGRVYFELLIHVFLKKEKKKKRANTCMGTVPESV